VRRGLLHKTVKLGQLAKQLRREATANPKKAGVLGLLAVVALWFWAPLVWGWIFGNEEEEGVKAAQATAQSAPASPTSAALPTPSGGSPESDAAAKKEETPRHPWQQLVQWMDDDPRMLPASALSGQRDPFVATDLEITQDKSNDAFPEVTPKSLGMVLTATMISPRHRVARINEASYQVGQTVKVTKDGREIGFTLEEVHRRQVVLSRHGNRYELVPPSSERSGRVKLVRSTN